MNSNNKNNKKDRLTELNEQCMKCIEKNGQNFDYCNLHCKIGAEIHMMDFTSKNGWGNHDYWGK